MTDNRCRHAIGVQENLFPMITKEEIRSSSETMKKFEAHRKMLEDERKRLLREQRATKMRALIHDWSEGLKRYRIRHVASMDQVNEALGVEKKTKNAVDGVENNINGSVYSHNNGKPGEKFKSLGWIKSTREGSNARQIKLWTMEKYWNVAWPMYQEEIKRMRESGVQV